VAHSTTFLGGPISGPFNSVPLSCGSRVLITRFACPSSIHSHRLRPSIAAGQQDCRRHTCKRHPAFYHRHVGPTQALPHLSYTADRSVNSKVPSRKSTTRTTSAPPPLPVLPTPHFPDPNSKPPQTPASFPNYPSLSSNAVLRFRGAPTRFHAPVGFLLLPADLVAAASSPASVLMR